MEPWITVLMPIYRGVEFFHEALASLRAQTCRNWELLVGINGLPQCSTTWELLYLYADKTPRATHKDRVSGSVRVLDLGELGGKAAALNAMMRVVQTDWVALLDVDDLWEPTKLARQLPYIQRYSVIGTQCIYFGERGGSPIIPLGEVPRDTFINENPIINSSAILRREDAQWDEEFNCGLEDYELWSRLVTQGKRFYNVPASLVRHRIHHTSHFNTRPHDETYAKIRERYHL